MCSHDRIPTLSSPALKSGGGLADDIDDDAPPASPLMTECASARPARRTVRDLRHAA